MAWLILWATEYKHTACPVSSSICITLWYHHSLGIYHPQHPSVSSMYIYVAQSNQLTCAGLHLHLLLHCILHLLSLKFISTSLDNDDKAQDLSPIENSLPGRSQKRTFSVSFSCGSDARHPLKPWNSFSFFFVYLLRIG